MTEETTHIPQLRFPEFEGEWARSKIGNKCDSIVPGRNKPKVFGGELPWLTTPDLNNKRIVFSSLSDLSISRDEAKNIGSKVVPKGAVLMSCVGDLGLVSIAGCDLIINQQLHAFIPLEGMDKDFLSNCIITNQKYLDRVATKTAVPYLNKDNCNSIPIIHPHFPEQQKIASFLTEVDKKIDLLQRKKYQLTAYKKGMMQKLFSQEIRFKDEDGKGFPEWEEKQLGEIATKINSKNTDNSVSRVLTNSAINGVIDQSDYFDHDVANSENLGGYYVIGKGDFVYNPRVSVTAPVGPIKRNNLGKGVMSPLYTIFRLMSENSDFLNCFFSSSLWHKYMKQVANYGARYDRMAISSNDFLKLPIPIPHPDEQQKIADYLTALDQKIELTDKKLAQAQSFKKGLLQQMFI